MPAKDKIRVGILRGGDEENYHSSLGKGGEIISYLHDNLLHKYRPIDILVDKEGVWHAKGVPIMPVELLHKVDVVWNLSHQRFSNILESFSIPVIGVPPFAPFFRESREMLRKNMKKLGIGMPRHIVLPLYQEDFDLPSPRLRQGTAAQQKKEYAIRKAKEVFQKFSSPWIVKSYTSDRNMGIHLAKTFPELVNSIEDGVMHGKSILVEEFIAGKVATVHSVPGFRGQEIYTFPFGTSFGIFSDEEKRTLATMAKKLHDHTGSLHYLKSDFILTPRGKVYLLYLEHEPDLKPDSHFTQVCEQIGAKTHHVIEHILEHAMK